MQQTHWLNSPFGKDIYQASSIHSNFKYHIDYWLIGKGDGYVDAKRIIPIMFLALFIVVAWIFLFVANEMEYFSHLFGTEILSDETRYEYVIGNLNYFYDKGRYIKLIFGLVISTIFSFLGLHYLFSPYPRPVRFNQKNGIVYTKFLGEIWVTDWDTAAIKMWRGTNYTFLIPFTHRGIALRMHSLDKNGHILTRWVLLSGANNNRLDDVALGGDPCLLYWNWLNTYMQGAVFEGVDGSNSKAKNSNKNQKVIPNPKIGRLWPLEKIMRFRGYKFPKSIDQQAIALNAKLKAQQLYPSFKGDAIPNNPFFTWQYHYPDRIMPNAQGKIILPKPILTDPAAIAAAQLEEELEQKLQAQGIDNVYKHYHVKELEGALNSETPKSAEEIALIKNYIKVGGYKYHG
ncbi:hypothetical protein WN093_00015 [Gammaproteobacteria bacterium AS21]